MLLKSHSIIFIIIIILTECLITTVIISSELTATLLPMTLELIAHYFLPVRQKL